jgi:methylglyoxal/glyoxal reductase
MKVRSAGVSNYLIEDLEDILNSSDIVPAVNQVKFHPFLCQEQIMRFANKNKIHLEYYSPLTFQNPPTRGKRLYHPNIVRTGKNTIRLQLRLTRWALQHDLVVTPKSTHEVRIQENSQVSDLNLDTHEYSRLHERKYSNSFLGLAEVKQNHIACQVTLHATSTYNPSC